MSWDALLIAAKTPPTSDEMIEFFSRDENVEISQDGEDFQVAYENEDTGVHFLIDHTKSEADETGPACVLAFNLNYVRPYFFALEAMPLLVSLARQFDLRIVDAQGDGQPALPEPQVLIDSWSQGNDWAIRAITKDKPLPYLAREVSNNHWRYRINRAKIQDRVGDDVYVPKLIPMRKKNSLDVVSVVTWGDAMSMVFPPCDQLAIVRKKTSLFTRKESFTRGILPAADVFHLIKPLLRPFEGPIPGMSILPPENQKAAAKIYGGLREQPIDDYEPLAPHQFVDVR